MTAPRRQIRIRGLTRKESVGDNAIALAAFGLTLALLAIRGGSANRGLDPLGGVLAAVAALPLVGRRRAPLTVFALTTAASATLNGLDYALGPPIGPTIALFFVATDRRTASRLRETGALVVGLFAVHIGATAIAHRGFPLTPLLFGILVWGAAWAIGDQVRVRRQRLADLEERALRAEREAERERRLAAAEERMRIARDLHDSAGHAINVILVQAGAARLLQERDPAAVRAALETIEEVARETIGEIDQLVRVLRDDTGHDGGAHAAVEPPRGLAALENVAARHRAAGLAVSVDVVGRRRSLPPAVDQAAYRILQEALTNAARHGLGEAQVEIGFGPSELAITVSNPTAVATAARNGGGHGIDGMRERAACLGGRIEAGQSNGLFRLHAHLPYAGEAGG